MGFMKDLMTFIRTIYNDDELHNSSGASELTKVLRKTIDFKKETPFNPTLSIITLALNKLGLYK